MKHVHHSLQSKKKVLKGQSQTKRMMCVSVERVYVCVLIEQSARLPAEQPRLCMNLAAYQLTFKLEPQSDCRPKG